jgi:hypothetical protein
MPNGRLTPFLNAQRAIRGEVWRGVLYLSRLQYIPILPPKQSHTILLSKSSFEL